MRLVVDRPADHQVWARSELLAGWLEGVVDAAQLRAVCGGTEMVVRPCLHPRGFERRDLHGFWTELILQRHRAAVRDGMLAVDFLWRDAAIATVQLRVSPVACTVAEAYPLDLDEYETPPPADGRGAAPVTLVFPGLGGVGGSSLNHLLRSKMLREGWATPVYDEANAPALWARVRAARPAAFRWIDGHGCYAAAELQGETAARVTLLRDPVARLVSVFNYGTLVHPERFAAGTFEAFVAAGEARRHSQAAGLLRAAGRGAEAEQAGIALHRAARDELGRAYALVGITERFEESVFLLCQLAGYDRIGMWRRVLAAPRAVEVDALGGGVRRRLTEDLAADLELYEEARTAFAARAATAALGATLARYRTAAARQRELPAAAKAVECLRWRQVLADHAAGLTIDSGCHDGEGA